MQTQDLDRTQPKGWLFSLISIFIIGLMLMVVLLLVGRFIQSARTTLNEETEVNPQQALERAEDALTSSELILSFLEGASVLIGIFATAASYFVYQIADRYQKNLEEHISVLQANADNLNKLPKRLEELDALEKNLQLDFNDLLQATQELNLKNYDVAYQVASRVLDRSPENSQALYIAGWLELQYVPDQLKRGIEHLKKAMLADPELPSIKAAYGVGLRRQALGLTGKERGNLLREAEGYMLQALGSNPNLLDPNRESFWGPVGGARRDQGDIDGAIAAYRNALKTTPTSSYPAGNLALLLLQKANRDQDMACIDEALTTFQRVTDLAERELSFNPNDYYPVMDLAMAYTMLGAENPANFHKADTWLQNALALDHTCQMLEVSMRGWRQLLEYTPEDWDAVGKQLQQTTSRLIDIIQAECGGLRET